MQILRCATLIDSGPSIIDRAAARAQGVRFGPPNALSAAYRRQSISWAKTMPDDVLNSGHRSSLDRSSKENIVADVHERREAKMTFEMNFH